jgi:type I restriction enzyme, R subunit
VSAGVNQALEEREWQTRRERIDPKLKALGWNVVPFRAGLLLSSLLRHAVTELPTDKGPADYALVLDGHIVGILEAKKLSLGPQNVLTQAERYARGLPPGEFNFGGLRAPFLYSTNGEVIWFQDVRSPANRSRRIASFHTPAALREMLGRDFEAECDRLKALPNTHSYLRPYQREANAAIEKSIADRKRTMLVAMATGTGKTFTMVNETYRLMKSGTARRVLFLVDRRALAAQAVREFASFEAEPGLKFDKIYEVYSQRFQQDDLEPGEKFDPKVMPSGHLTNPKLGAAFVYVCTIQRMARYLFPDRSFDRGDDDEKDLPEPLPIPIHAFDLIIADECHRGYTAAEQSLWRDTLDHFDAIKLGLTATPAKHTTAYFRDIVYRYDYRRAVDEGFLVDYDAFTIKSGVLINGVFLKEGEQVRTIDTKSGAQSMDQLEDERQFEAAEVEKKITVPDTNHKIIEEIKKYALDHEQRQGRFPKTLIFAANDVPHVSHADQLVGLCRDAFGRGDSFVAKITGTVDRPLQRIREFRNRPAPAIVVSVDLMSTGVDIPNLEFIVFLRPVKSRILWEQMLGRGTRLGTLSPPKSHFTIFDCFDGSLLNYFKNASAFTEDPPDKPTRTIQEIIQAIWDNRDRVYNVKCLSRRMLRIDKEMSGNAREIFAAYIPDGDVKAFANRLPAAITGDFTATMNLLRDKKFQKLLVNYERARPHFIVAHELTDEVTSGQLIRGAGNEYKPKDYLAVFSRFIRDNPERIEAIRILLNRPKDWNTDALAELRKKLASTPEHFTVDNLQKAHEARYHKALVDIISMVKHAAKEEEPLFSAPERVERALKRMAIGHKFTAEQEKWFERIRSHLVENLSISRDDFDIVPVFSHHGGWKPADRAFNGKLSALLSEINGAIAQ